MKSDESGLSHDHEAHCPSKNEMTGSLQNLINANTMVEKHTYKVSVRSKGELFGRSFVIEQLDADGTPKKK